MKVKVISRSADEFTRERSNDLQVIHALSWRYIYIVFESRLNRKVAVFLLPVSEFAIYLFELEKRVFRNYDPSIRSQEKAVEYVRALNAAKLDKVNFFCFNEEICSLVFC